MIFSVLSSVAVLALELPWAIVDTCDHGHIYIKPADWYADAHNFVLKESLMSDQLVDVRYDPERPNYYTQVYDFIGNENLTRGVVVTILSRFDGHLDTLHPQYYNDDVCDTFVDVPDGEWLTPAVNWAFENGITGGVGGSYFAPDRTVTREEFAALLYRYTEYREAERDTYHDISTYPDSADVSDFAVDAMKWAVGCGLISGKPGGLLAPKDTITRAEVALIMYRYNDVVPHLDEAIR